MTKNDVLLITMIMLLVICVIQILFIFGFCIPVINDYRTQIEIYHSRGQFITDEEYFNWKGWK